MQRILIAFMGLVLQGFFLSPAMIPTSDIISGGPPKDGIPALSIPTVFEADSS
ncbi:MAG: hypothetical protein R8K49_04130 [Mariprofundaceae bacterium]